MIIVYKMKVVDTDLLNNHYSIIAHMGLTLFRIKYLLVECIKKINLKLLFTDASFPVFLSIKVFLCPQNHRPVYALYLSIIRMPIQGSFPLLRCPLRCLCRNNKFNNTQSNLYLTNISMVNPSFLGWKKLPYQIWQFICCKQKPKSKHLYMYILQQDLGLRTSEQKKSQRRPYIQQLQQILHSMMKEQNWPNNLKHT